KIVEVEPSVIFHLCVVKEITVDPEFRRCLLHLGAKLFDNASNRDELHLKGIANQDFIKQNLALRMVVAIDKSRHDRHLLCIDRVLSFVNEFFGGCSIADKNEA